MNKKLLTYTIIGILFVSGTGTLLHFVYDWSGQNRFLGFFTPVSESTWEHMKLVFFPMAFYSIPAICRCRQYRLCPFSGFVSGTLLATLLIPVIFYTYTGILGTNFLFLDISSFILSVILGFTAAYYLTLNCLLKNYGVLLLLLAILMTAGFFYFTYHPPRLGLFSDTPLISCSEPYSNAPLSF